MGNTVINKKENTCLTCKYMTDEVCYTSEKWDRACNYYCSKKDNEKNCWTY